MKIMITGATGFIGSNLTISLVKKGFDIGIIVRDSSDLSVLSSVVNDISIFPYSGSLPGLISDFEEFKPDAVIHLAAFFVAEHQSDQVDKLIDSNIRFTAHILEAMHQTGVSSLINTSTSWQNFNDEEFNPVSLYAATKQAAEDLIRYYSESFGLNAVNLVIYDSFGPFDKRSKLISLFKKIAGTESILKMSPGEQEIDLIYITDILDAYQLTIDMLTANMIHGSEKYHLRSGSPMNLKETADVFSDVYELALPIEWGGRPYRLREVMKACTSGKVLPGWTPKISLKDGLKLIKESEAKI